MTLGSNDESFISAWLLAFGDFGDSMGGQKLLQDIDRGKGGELVHDIIHSYV
jgi:hypothetical protein